MNSRRYSLIGITGCVVSSLLCLAGTARADFLIDDYAVPITPDALVGAFGGVDSRGDVLPSPVPYPYSARVTTVTASALGVISATVGGGQIIDISAFNTGGDVHLAYAAPGTGPVNFFAGGATNFAFDLLSSTSNGALTVTIVANGAASTGPVPIPVNPNPATFLIPIPANPNFAAASFFDVFFDLQGGATSVSVDSLYTPTPITGAVPEPVTAVVWLVGISSCFGFVWFRRSWSV